MRWQGLEKQNLPEIFPAQVAANIKKEERLKNKTPLLTYLVLN
jgi:hypothetical protein